MGKARLDLRGLQITSLNLDIDVGDVTLFLPSTGASYEATISGGVGKLETSIENGASMSLDIRGDVGNVILDLPEDSEARLEAETDVGNVRVPGRFDLLQEDKDRLVGEKGIWQTPGYKDADRAITIVFHGSVGSLTIR